MVGIFRILHFSDIHAGLVEWKWKYLLDKRFFGRLNQFSCRQKRLRLENIAFLAENYSAINADMALCTGDLTSIGSPEEFDNALKLLKPLLEAADGNFLYVPGNHDAYVSQNHDALVNAFNILNDGKAAFEELPTTFTVGPVEFILLNPARPCRIWQSTGELSPFVWQKLDYILSNPARAHARVLATHFPIAGPRNHPLSWRTKFIDWQRLAEHARNGAFQAILSGHVHKSFCTAPENGCGAWQIGAGSLTIYDTFAIIDVNTNTGEITPNLLKI
ncbi:MAG: metallophosphoesterase [Lentisphaeria bacterium]|nr:metallophosphoesterase [Lentisphaeria bacterium]